MSEFFTLDNGDRLYLEENGEADADFTAGRPTVIALHGLGGAGYFFAGLGRSGCARVLAPDMPGSGFSPRGSQRITLDRLADCIVQLIQRKAPTGPIVLMGHSMGTIVALKVYARVPDCINSLIFVGGLPAPLTDAKSRFRERAALVRSVGMATIAPAIVPVVFARRSLDTIPDKVAMFQRLVAQSDGEGYAQTAEALADASAEDVVARVGIPCLCITGTEDRYAPPTAVRPFADSIPGAVYRELPDCGHLPFFETPQPFSAVLNEFLKLAEKKKTL